jgi:MFS family permease
MGYAIGVLNSPEQVIRNCTQTEEFFKPCLDVDGGVTSIQWSVIQALMTVGALAGALPAGIPFSLKKGFIIDFIGRRLSIFLTNVFFIIGILMMSIFSNYYVFCAGRVIIGFGIGICSAAIPTYISELSPSSKRGSLVTFHQLFVTVGIFVSQLMGIGLSKHYLWRILLGIFIVSLI